MERVRGRPRGPELRGRARRSIAYVIAVRRACVAAGRAIERARLELGIAVSELAAAVGVTCGTVHRWESGMVLPSLARLHQIADALGVPVDHLTGVA